MPKTIALIGALDTKGHEFAFVKQAITQRGHLALVIDTGVMGEPRFAPDVAAHEIAAAAGTDLASLRTQADRGKAIEMMAKGAAMVVKALYEQGKIHHVGTFAALEDQLCSWTPGEKSPDVLSLLVEVIVTTPAASCL